jgi:hypothetical protein
VGCRLHVAGGSTTAHARAPRSTPRSRRGAVCNSLGSATSTNRLPTRPQDCVRTHSRGQQPTEALPQGEKSEPSTQQPSSPEAAGPRTPTYYSNRPARGASATGAAQAFAAGQSQGTLPAFDPHRSSCIRSCPGFFRYPPASLCHSGTIYNDNSRNSRNTPGGRAQGLGSRTAAVALPAQEHTGDRPLRWAEAAAAVPSQPPPRGPWASPLPACLSACLAMRVEHTGRCPAPDWCGEKIEHWHAAAGAASGVVLGALPFAVRRAHASSAWEKCASAALLRMRKFGMRPHAYLYPSS